MRKAWMNNPHTLPRLRKQLVELRRQMEDNKAGMGKASNEASREKYYKAIGQTQHAIDILKNDIERVEDKNYHLM